MVGGCLGEPALCSSLPIRKLSRSLGRSGSPSFQTASVRSSFSSPDVVDLGRGKREGEEKEQKGRTDGRRSNNASTKGETLLADSTPKSQKLAACGCDGNIFNMILCIAVRDYIVMLDCEINALPYQLSSCKALCRQVTERGGKGNAENTSPTQQRHRICDLRPKLTLHSVGLLSKGRERAGERKQPTFCQGGFLPRSLLHAGKRARVIYTRAGGRIRGTSF